MDTNGIAARIAARDDATPTSHPEALHSLDLIKGPSDSSAESVYRALTEKSLKDAHRKAVHKHHPDRGGSPEDFRRADEAYKYLLKDVQASAPFSKGGGARTPPPSPRAAPPRAEPAKSPPRGGLFRPLTPGEMKTPIRQR
jgi:hypothetical protein